MALNEADTRAKLIDPKVKLAGWGESQIEHYFVKGRKSQLTCRVVNVNARKIAAMPLPLPDLDTQEQIVAHLDAVQSEVDKMNGVLDEEERLLDRLERPILERAFRGEQ